MKLPIQRLAVLFTILFCITACASAPAQPAPSPDDGQGQTPVIPEGPAIPVDSPNPVLPEEEAESFILSFAGDCTFATNFNAPPNTGFPGTVGSRYDYPFSNVLTYFENDDFTIVNLECALTESDPTEEEMEELATRKFRFRGPKEYAKILTAGSVEFASCANNHSKDYGTQGLYDTWDALEAENIYYASFNKTCLATTESGLKIGLIACNFWLTEESIRAQSQDLRNRGAELIVVSIHWGNERLYYPLPIQEEFGHTAIDAGADIVFGHHSHTLQPIEQYNGGVIFYSLGNFSFGGNNNPGDKDTAILQQEVLRYADGTVALGDLTVIPCQLSSVSHWNDFRPTPYEVGSEGYLRVLQKLDGTYETPV